MYGQKRTVLFQCLMLFSMGLSACQPALSKTLETPVPLPTETPQPPTAAPTFPPTTTLTPEPTLTATPAGCLETSGRIEHIRVNDPTLVPPLEGNVYLPPCYPEAGRSYPVVILLHGQSMDEDVWRRIGLYTTADKLITSGEVPPFIVVMPRELYYLQDVGQSTYGEAVVKVLVPWVRKTYPTCPGRVCLAIGGLSRGALWATLLGWLNWQVFGSIGSHSLPNSPFTEIVLRDLVKTIPSEQIPRQYLDVGVVDGFLGASHEFEALLTKYSMPHTWIVNLGGHNEEYWTANVPTYLRWYGEPWNALAKKLAPPAP
jgi:enterochelin esterase-like enzyme